MRIGGVNIHIQILTPPIKAATACSDAGPDHHALFFDKMWLTGKAVPPKTSGFSGLPPLIFDEYFKIGDRYGWKVVCLIRPFKPKPVLNPSRLRR